MFGRILAQQHHISNQDGDGRICDMCHLHWLRNSGKHIHAIIIIYNCVFIFPPAIHTFSLNRSADIANCTLYSHRAHATEYTPIPLEQIQRQHGEIYRSKRANPEDLIAHPENEPLTDDVGYEVKFFDGDGRRIRRREANVDLDDPTSTCGILLNLPSVDHMMTQSFDEPFHDSKVFISNPTIHKYPMAFLRDAGQIQSRQPFPLLTTPL